MFLLDTDHISFLQRTTSPEFLRISARINRHNERNFFFSVVSFHEQALGWNSLINQSQNRTGILRGYKGFEQMIVDYADVQILPYDERAAMMFDELRSVRIKIGTLDLRIAAIALVHRLTALTRNVVDFKQVPGLSVDDWTS